MRIAFATHSAHPEIEDDDRPLAEALAGRGALVMTSPWDHPEFDWGVMDLVVLRSPWDYFHHCQTFLDWLARVEPQTQVVNPPEVVRWNMNKRYLTEFPARGIHTTPTVFLPRRQPASLTDLCEAQGWGTVVLKPAVSADSWETVRIAPEGYADGQTYLERHLPDRDLLVQPFIKDVEEGGEQCLLFFGGAYSHAVRKNSAFRGGRHVGPEGLLVSPTKDAIEMAHDVLLKAEVKDLPYARVDIARDNQGEPMLMELELFEPTLFFREKPGSEAFLADLLLSS